MLSDVLRHHNSTLMSLDIHLNSMNLQGVQVLWALSSSDVAGPRRTIMARMLMSVQTPILAQNPIPANFWFGPQISFPNFIPEFSFLRNFIMAQHPKMANIWFWDRF